MKILINEELKKYTTIKIGGLAKKLYIPESVDELCHLVKEYSPKKFLGGGLICLLLIMNLIKLFY